MGFPAWAERKDWSGPEGAATEAEALVEEARAVLAERPAAASLALARRLYAVDRRTAKQLAACILAGLTAEGMAGARDFLRDRVNLEFVWRAQILMGVDLDLYGMRAAGLATADIVSVLRKWIRPSRN